MLPVGQDDSFMSRQRLLLPGSHPRARPQGAAGQAPAHPPLPAAHQRQGRALHPHPARRLGLRGDLPHLRGTPRRARRLARLLPSTTTTRLPRPPTTATAAGGPHKEQPGWFLRLEVGGGVAPSCDRGSCRRPASSLMTTNLSSKQRCVVDAEPPAFVRSSGRTYGRPQLLRRAEDVLDLLVRLRSDRECGDDASSTSRRAVDLDRAAERLDSVLQPDEP
jgi:hypothetical protein